MNKKRAVGLAFIYVGTVVGAGFSSGQEIWRFFARHQESGIYSVLLVSIFFTILAPLFFRLGKKRGIKNYHCFFYNYLPGPLPYFFDLMYSCFLIGSVSVMLAGTGAIFKDLLGLPFFIGVLITLLLILITLSLKNEGIMTINSILIPILTIITIYTVLSFLSGIKPIDLSDMVKNQGNNLEWLKDSILYGSYNLVMSIAAMTNIVYQEEEKDIVIGGIMGGVILTVLCLFIYIGLITVFKKTPEQEIPLLYMAKKGGINLYLSYIVALYFAMVTTAIANYNAFTKRLVSLIKINYRTALLLTILFVIPLVPSGFSVLVNNLYPIFGFIGIIITIFYFLLFFNS
ncbi:MAG: hypothetical protein ACOCQW_04985 [Halanaerobiaceae bacterium]